MTGDGCVGAGGPVEGEEKKSKKEGGRRLAAGSGEGEKKLSF